MLQVQRGELRAFEELVDKYKQAVVNLIARMLGDPAEAEDLGQNVFVQVFRSAGRYRVSAKFSTWLFTIARNLCLNELRRRSRHPAQSLDDPHPSSAQTRHPVADRDQPGGRTLLEGELVANREALLDLRRRRLAILLWRDEDLPMGTSRPCWAVP
jgi:RNA polymerase sigma-70 factor (ECF subfamily)